MNRNVTATILIILAIGIYFTVTQSVIDQAKKVQAVNGEYRGAIDSANRLITTLNHVIDDYNNVSQKDRERLAKMVPTSVDNIRLIIDLNGVALKHGFSLQGVKTSVSANKEATQKTGQAAAAVVQAQPSASTPNLDTVDVTFQVTAPYLQFKGFMQDLEADLRIMDITSLSMTATDSGVYDFKVGLRTYWLRQQ
jgi:Tfp pilus assembly protein PilO